MSLFDKKLTEIHSEIDKGELTVSDLVNASFERIGRTEDKVRAFILLDEENARARAKELDEQQSHGEEKGWLFGLPAGIKDNIVTKNVTTTCASKLLANYSPIYNASVMDRLHAAQSVMIGKLNMDEFAMGGSTENSGFHNTYNPWNLEYVPGGSSGGSAASVAAGQVY
ncbi:amidase, partial [Bacillus licheniformis]|uniref:amidase family protein n=1 Tax=Bacillus licheniformis TaxID=1402 RepID=UPI00237C652F